MFLLETGVHAFAAGFIGPSRFGPALAKEVRISVQTWPVSYAAFSKVRPEDVNRKLRFEGPPERTIAVDRLQSQNHFRLPDFTHLEPFLQRSYEHKLVEELT